MLLVGFKSIRNMTYEAPNKAPARVPKLVTVSAPGRGSGKVRIRGGVVVDYSAGLNHVTTKTFGSDVGKAMSRNSVNTQAEDSREHLRVVARGISNAHMVTPKVLEFVDMFCADSNTQVAELEAMSKGWDAIGNRIREGLEKRQEEEVIKAEEKQIRAEEEAKTAMGIEDIETPIEKKLEEELELLKQNRRMQLRAEILAEKKSKTEKAVKEIRRRIEERRRERKGKRERLKEKLEAGKTK